MKRLWILVLVLAFVLAGTMALISCFTVNDDDDDDGQGDDDYSGDDDDDVSDDDDDDDSQIPEETWTDPATGLMWQEPYAEDCMYWTDAIDYCDGLNWASYNNWHLPTIGELRSLIKGCPTTETDGTCGVSDECLENNCLWDNSEACSGCEILEGPGNEGCYWDSFFSNEFCGHFWSSSSVTDLFESYAWYVLFDRAQIGQGAKVEQYTWCLDVRCVR